ncbi:MAG TPA: tape measure protein [Cellvibrionaceae bacterium]
MSQQIGSVAVTVSADVNGLINDMSRAANAMTGFGDRASQVISTAAKFTTAMVAAAAASRGLHELMSRADEWTQFGNKIRVVTQELGTFQATQTAVFDLAQNIRAPIDEVSATYSRLQNSAKSLGVSQAEVLKVTEGLMKSFMAFGASGSEAASTALQLGQALGAGRLNGDELKAVMESSLPVAEAIAKHFNVTTGELKNLGAQGKLTSKEVFEALKEGSEGFIKSFDTVAPTFKQGMDVLSNSTTRAVGEFAKFTEVSESVGSALSGLGNYIDAFSQSVSSGQFGQLTSIIAGQWRNLLGSEIPGALNEFALFAGTFGEHIADNFSRGWYQVIPNLKAAIQAVTIEVASVLDVFTEEKIKNQVKQDSLDAIWAERDAAVQSAQQQVTASQQKLAAYQEELKVKAQALAITREEIKSAPQADPKTKKAQERAALKEEKHQQKVDDVVGGLRNNTAGMQTELNKRSEILAIYRQYELDSDATYYQRQLNDIQIQEAVKQAEILAAQQKEDAQREQRRLLDIERVAGDKGAIALINDQYNQQEILAEQIKQDQLTQVHSDAKRSRENLRRIERENAISMALSLGDGLMTATQGHSKRAFEFSKKVALVSAGVSGVRSAVSAWEAGMSVGGPWAPLVAAGYTAASLLKTGGLITSIRSASFSGGPSSSGGGDSGGAASAVGAAQAAAGAPAAAAPTSVMTVKGLNPNDLFTGSAVRTIAKELLSYQKDGGQVFLAS